MPPALESELLLDRVLQDLNRTDAFDAYIEFWPKDKLIVHWNKNDTLMFYYDGQKWLSSSAWGLQGQEAQAPLRAGHLKASCV